MDSMLARLARVLGLALAALVLTVTAPAALADGGGDRDRDDDRHGHHGDRDDDDDDDDRGRGGKHRDIQVQLLGLNDFHGNLEPPTGSGGRIGTIDAGGVEFLATHIRNLERGHRNSLVVSAGDLIGASPLLSAAFHDEPTIEAMNKLGLDLNAVGNHEFDEGEAELVRMARGGCHPTDSAGTCKGPDGRFRGSKFDFLAANVVKKSNGRTLFAPYAVERFDGVKVGFIGMTLEGTPDIVSPSGIANLRFLDEADTANQYARILRRHHDVDAIVVLLHEGGVQNPANSDPTLCNSPTGPIVDIVSRTTDDVDLFITGHTHQAYDCLLDNREGEQVPVTSASSFGRIVTDIDMEIDRRRGVESVATNNKIITRKAGELDVMKAPDMTALIQHYNQVIAPIRDRVIGRSTAVISRDNAPDNGDESPAGNLIADAQLAASDDAGNGQAVAAFMNPGGVRADFPAGDITYGAAFTVQPFGNNLTTITLTGAQLYTMLKQQWCGLPSRRVLQPSHTVRYTYDPAKAVVSPPPTGTPCASAPDPIVPGSFTINAEPVPNDASRSYRITVNSFLADGGDGFPVLPQGTDRIGGEVDTKALEDYIAPSLTGPPIEPPATTRITRLAP